MNTLNDLYLARPDLRERIEDIWTEHCRYDFIEQGVLNSVSLVACRLRGTEGGAAWWWGFVESLDT